MRFPDVLVQLKHMEETIRSMQWDIDQLWKQLPADIEKKYRGRPEVNDDDTRPALF
jgi:hypothetical protein